MSVTYTKDMHAKAKAERLALLTIDITGKHMGKGGVTFQGFLFTPEEVTEMWKVFEAFVRRNSKSAERKRK